MSDPDGGALDMLQEGGVVLETNMGTIAFELYWDEAPLACQNFTELARKGYYNGTVFHRIIKNFMAQGGDPTGTGRGGDSSFGGPFKDEITPKLKHTGAGILSMANSGPGTNKSQFFVTLAPCPWLDGKHTIFGRVVAGMRFVQRIGLVPTDKGDHPDQPVRVLKASTYAGRTPPDFSTLQNASALSST